MQHYGLAFYSLRNKKVLIMFLAPHKAITVNLFLKKIKGPEQTTWDFRQTY